MPEPFEQVGRVRPPDNLLDHLAVPLAGACPRTLTARRTSSSIVSVVRTFAITASRIHDAGKLRRRRWVGKCHVSGLPRGRHVSEPRSPQLSPPRPRPRKPAAFLDDDVAPSAASISHGVAASSSIPEASAFSRTCSGRNAPTIAEATFGCQHPRERELAHRDAEPRRDRDDTLHTTSSTASLRHSPIIWFIRSDVARVPSGGGSPACTCR